jgi:hypothetical protein
VSVFRRYTDEMVSRANNIDLVTYAASQGYEVKKQGNDYKLAGQGGLLIKADRKTWWHDITDKGGGPIQFVMLMKDKEWADAVAELINVKVQAAPVQPAAGKADKPSELILPERAANQKRLFAYLCNTRGIDQKIVYDFVHRRNLYQDVRGNCVFVTYEGDKPIFASLRSTLTEGTFRGDVAGSRKVGWGRGLKANDSLYVFESPIDLMSCMTLQKQRGEDIDGVNYISVGGVSASPLIRCLDKNPSIRCAVICTDNDEAGEKFYLINKPLLEERGIRVLRDRPCGKDWNEDLCSSPEHSEVWEPDC